MTEVFTIGHSTRDIDEFIKLLEVNNVKRLVDIRTVPRSRHNPQFEQVALKTSLEARGIDYVYLKELGGLRPKAKQSTNLAWRNQSFRNYADYMQTNDFAEGIESLISLANEKITAIMCAEAVPWRCHRSLVGDALLARDLEVSDIMSETKTSKHKLTSFAVVDGTNVTYPASDEASVKTK